MNLQFLNGLKDYVNIEIKEADKLTDEIKNLFIGKINPLNRDQQTNIDLTKYFSINLTDNAKQKLKWVLLGLGGLAVYQLFFKRR